MSKAVDVDVASWESEVLKSEIPVVVDFWAPWCGPCRMVGPEIDKLAGRAGASVKFVKLNVDEAQAVAVQYGVMSIPTIIKFDQGEPAARVTGARGADALSKDLALGV